MVIPENGSNGCAWREGRVYSLQNKLKAARKKGWEGCLTVNTQTITMPRKTAKNTQPVQAVVFRPVNKFAIITEDIAIVYEHIIEFMFDKNGRLRTVENS